MAIRINRGGDEQDRQAKYRLTEEQRQAMFLKLVEEAKQKTEHVKKQGCGGCRRNKGNNA